MPTFFVGDDLGAVKLISYAQSEDGWKPLSSTLLAGSSEGKQRAIQKLAAFNQADSQPLLATAQADGTTSVLSISEDGLSADTVSEWKETRLNGKFVGLAVAASGVYTCTSNGALRLTKPKDDDTPDSQFAALPTRLAEWRLAANAESFAYAGEEVELSVWNTERAFKGVSTSQDDAGKKKRKRGDDLLPGELWRARNVAHDELNLRQPVRNTAFTYLQQPTNPVQQHLIVGTQLGDVRRYDTKAGKRPVSNWKGIGKVGGIGVVEVGCHEHDVFVSDKGCNLFALDLRNGKVCYSYKGLSGAVTSVASSSPYLASTSQDRFFRLHSTFPPPSEVGQQQEKKGDISDKHYMKVVPTCVVAGLSHSAPAYQEDDEKDEAEGGNGDDVWDKMEDVESSEEDDSHKKRKTKKALK